MMQPLLGTNAREIADDVGRLLARRGWVAVPSEIQSRINDVEAVARDAEVAGHEIGEVSARGDETVDLAAVVGSSQWPGRDRTPVKLRERYRRLEVGIAQERAVLP